MRLKRDTNRTVGEKKYYRWSLTNVPPAIVKKAKWKDGDHLEAIVKKDGVLIRPKE